MFIVAKLVTLYYINMFLEDLSFHSVKYHNMCFCTRNYSELQGNLIQINKGSFGIEFLWLCGNFPGKQHINVLYRSQCGMLVFLFPAVLIFWTIKTIKFWPTFSFPKNPICTSELDHLCHLANIWSCSVWHHVRNSLYWHWGSR